MCKSYEEERQGEECTGRLVPTHPKEVDSEHLVGSGEAAEDAALGLSEPLVMSLHWAFLPSSPALRGFPPK